MIEKALPGDIEDPSEIFPSKSIGTGPGDEGKLPTPSRSFSSFMTPKSPAVESPATSQTSPFALMQGNVPLATTPNVDTLLGQVNKMQGTALNLQNQLNTPSLKLKASTKYLVKNKLSEANDNLLAINNRLGTTTPPAPSAMTGPLGKFLGYLTHGQAMMEGAKAQLQQIKSDGSSMSPGDFLLVQLKMNKAQQLLEFSSVLLSNAVSDIKQFMQIQL